MRYILMSFNGYVGTVEAVDVETAMEYIFDNEIDGISANDEYYWDYFDGTPVICKPQNLMVSYSLHEEKEL